MVILTKYHNDCSAVGILTQHFGNMKIPTICPISPPRAYYLQCMHHMALNFVHVIVINYQHVMVMCMVDWSSAIKL